MRRSLSAFILRCGAVAAGLVLLVAHESPAQVRQNLRGTSTGKPQPPSQVRPPTGINQPGLASDGLLAPFNPGTGFVNTPRPTLPTGSSPFATYAPPLTYPTSPYGVGLPYGAVNPFGAFNPLATPYAGFNPYGAFNPYGTFNPYGAFSPYGMSPPVAGFAPYGGMSPYAPFNPYPGVNPYGTVAPPPTGFNPLAGLNPFGM